MVRDFYAKYVVMIKNMNPSSKDKDIRKYPWMYMVWVRDFEIDISIQTISNALFKNTFELVEEIPDYDF